MPTLSASIAPVRGPRPRPATVALAAALLVAGWGRPALALDYSFGSGSYQPGLTAPDPLGAGDRLLITAGGGKIINGVTLDNRGTVLWQADALQGANGGRILNSGLIDLQSDAATLQWVSGGQPLLSNTGELRKSAGSLNNLGNWSIVNSGSLNAQVGTLNFNGGNNQFNDGSRFIGAGVVQVSSHSGFAGNLLSDNLRLSGGDLIASGAVLAGGVAGAGLIDWAGGNLRGSWTVAAGSTLRGVTGGSKVANVGLNLVNQGTIQWTTADQLLGANGAQVDNRGLFDGTASTSLQWVSGGQPLFTNQAGGTLRASNGATFAVGNWQLVNAGGLLEATAGSTLLFDGGSAQFQDGTRFQGAGSNRVTGAAGWSGQISSANLLVAGGVQTADVAGASLHGATTFSGGDWRGHWDFAPDHVLTLVDGATRQLNVGFNGTQRGTWRLASADTLNWANSAQLTNTGLIESTVSTSMTWNSGGLPKLINAAGGVVRANAATTLSIGSIAYTSDGGTQSAQAGGVLLFNGNSNQFNAGSQFVGAGVNRVTGNTGFAGAYTSVNLEIAGGIQQGAGAVQQGTTLWTGGDLRGDWTTASGATMVGASGTSKQLNVGYAGTNQGSWLWQTGQALLMANSASFSNAGLFEAQATSGVVWNSGGQPVFTNTGTLRAASGVTFDIGGVSFVNNGGTLQALAGGQLVYSGSSNQFNAGTQFTGAGVNRVHNGSTFSGAYTAANLELAGGILQGAHAVAQGTTRWTAGDLRGSWLLASGHTLVGETGGSKQLNVGLNLTNQGAIRWQTTDALLMANGAQITNQGLLDLQADASVVWNSGGQPNLVNQGVIRKSGGIGTSGVLVSGIFSNPAGGTLDVQTGTIALPTNFSNDGTLMGNGRFSLGGTLDQRGLLRPGDGIGTLTLATTLAQAAGATLEIELDTLSSHDLLVLTGGGSLGGTLQLVCAGLCSFADGTRLQIVDGSAALGGTFNSVQMQGFLGGSWTVDDSQAAVGDLFIVANGDILAAVPEPGSWALWSAGLLALGLRAARRRKPDFTIRG